MLVPSLHVLVSACCVLHNICEIHGDEFNEEWMDGVDRNDHLSVSATSTQTEENSTDTRSQFGCVQGGCVGGDM